MQFSLVEVHTKSPSNPMHNSNRCLIFIAALLASKILVSSNHSFGVIQGGLWCHVQAMSIRYVIIAIRTMEQLVAILRRRN